MPSKTEQINKPGPKFAFDDCFLYETRCHFVHSALDWLIRAAAGTGRVRVISARRGTTAWPGRPGSPVRQFACRMHIL